VPYPPLTQNLHHEVELVVALGRGGAEVGVEGALELVYGYTVGVDLTRRDLQAAARQAGRPWTTAKGFDRSAPLAPVQPVGRCGHPRDAAIRLSVNGTLRQQGNTADMTWSVRVIAELSRYRTQAGDCSLTLPGRPLNRATWSNAAEGLARLEFRMEAP
jgi:fumarylpyruvate hydrolase